MDTYVSNTELILKENVPAFVVSMSASRHEYTSYHVFHFRILLLYVLQVLSHRHGVAYINCHIVTKLHLNVLTAT